MSGNITPPTSKGLCDKRITNGEREGKIYCQLIAFLSQKEKLVKERETLFKGEYYPTCPFGWGERLMKREYKRQIGAHGDNRV